MRTMLPSKFASLPFLLGAIAAAGIALGPAAPAAVHADTSTASSGISSTTLAADETGLVNAINTARASNGLPALVTTPDLMALARSRSQDQVARQYFSHYTPGGKTIFDLLNAANIPWTTAGENLAESQGMDPVQTAISEFLASPLHRANVLSPDFGHVGVGAAARGDGTTVLTVDFTD